MPAQWNYSGLQAPSNCRMEPSSRRLLMTSDEAKCRSKATKCSRVWDKFQTQVQLSKALQFRTFGQIKNWLPSPPPPHPNTHPSPQPLPSSCIPFFGGSKASEKKMKKRKKKGSPATNQYASAIIKHDALKRSGREKKRSGRENVREGVECYTLLAWSRSGQQHGVPVHKCTLISTLSQFVFSKHNHKKGQSSNRNAVNTKSKKENNPAFNVFTALMIIFMEKNYNWTGKRTWTRRKRERAPTMIVSGHKKSCHQLQTWTWKWFHAGRCVSPCLLSLCPSIFSLSAFSLSLHFLPVCFLSVPPFSPCLLSLCPSISPLSAFSLSLHFLPVCFLSVPLFPPCLLSLCPSIFSLSAFSLSLYFPPVCFLSVPPFSPCLLSLCPSIFPQHHSGLQ